MTTHIPAFTRKTPASSTSSFPVTGSSPCEPTSKLSHVPLTIPTQSLHNPTSFLTSAAHLSHVTTKGTVAVSGLVASVHACSMRWGQLKTHTRGPENSSSFSVLTPPSLVWQYSVSFRWLLPWFSYVIQPSGYCVKHDVIMHNTELFLIPCESRPTLYIFCLP